MHYSVLPLAKKLIRIKSTLHNPKALQAALDLSLSSLPGFTVEKFGHRQVNSALIYNTPARPEKFKIILNGHLDVIPGKDYQYSPKIVGDKLYGVGSMDMKANVACLITVFREVAAKVDYPLALQLVTDEESGGIDGTKYQIDQGVRSEFVIAGESTNFNIVHQSKGILWLKISFTGKTAHGAYPWKGENAILMAHEFITSLYNKYPSPRQDSWTTTINLSRTETANTAYNKIPDNCIVYLDIRHVPGQSKKVLASVKKLLPGRSSLEIVMHEPSILVRENNTYLRSLLKISEQVTHRKVVLYGAQGSSDARHYSRVGGSGIEFGPTGGGIGTDHEWVSISSLDKYCEVLSRYLLNLSTQN